jgi:16S rRNA (guanine527-N7)-methyltransferase
LQASQFGQLQELLRHWNSRLNLTRLVEGDDYWIGQVFDSLWPLQPWLTNPNAELSVIDVGTGGGFPGLAIAIALPKAQLTLVDSVGRKLEAVGAMAQELGLGERVQLRCERAEKSGREKACRGRFQLAVARAVAAAPVVAEYLVPLLTSSGTALLYRGQWSSEDAEQLARAALLLKAQVGEARALDLPRGRGQRHGIPLTPQAPCPSSYPRAVGIPAKQPLGQQASA